MLKIIPAVKLSGQAAAPQSKSFMHRYMICGALSPEHTEIECSNYSADIMATKGCLVELGLYMGKGPVIGADICRLDCGESGSTYRFLLPVSAALGKKCEFVLKGNLASRPMDPLFKVLRAHGVIKEDLGGGHIRTSGQLTAGTFLLPGNVSSQYVSGLLMALPILKENSTIIVAGELQSKGYVDMTIEVMRKAGVTVHVTEQGDGKGIIYKVPGRQTYRLEPGAKVEGDWSNAAFWLVAGAISDTGVTCTNLNMESFQGDRQILDIIRRFGAEVTVAEDSVTVKRGNLHGIIIDAANIPDIVPPLAVLACAADGATVIRNAERLRMKESDRLESVSSALNALGAAIVVTKDGLIIDGQGMKGLKGGQTQSFNDHRIAMMSAIAAGICKDSVIIENAEAVSKSYPAFFDDLAGLQGVRSLSL
ncbi:MAG: 3-phosphoshikimate 1-carboxyvinyltransferase [Lachnospiraceae bacterium]|nr:3-phosphoshikimate 1-carboxyvinyltransferase [Lachnospiraceae bacterium]